MRQIKIAILVFFNVLLLGQYLISCSKDASPKILNSETFEITGGDGQCYLVTLDKYLDNSVSMYKKAIPCSTGFSKRIGAYESGISTTSSYKGDEEMYWMISLLDEYPPIEIGGGGGDYYCDCEEIDNDDLCSSVPTECLVENAHDSWRARTYVTCTGICCTDCDLTYCPTCVRGSNDEGKKIPIGNGAIIVKASRINTEKTSLTSRSTSVLNGNGIQMIFVDNNGAINITRSVNSSNNSPAGVYNLTTLQPSGDHFDIPENGNYWYVSFQMGTRAIRINSSTAPHCYSDDCDGECEMGPSTQHPGCLDCDCIGKGDCDMSTSYSMGGVIVSGESINIVDIQ